MDKKFAVIICAAGDSKRFGGKRKKPFVDVDGRAVFLRSVELFSGRSDVKQILLSINEEDAELVDIKWGANLKFFNVQICIGGRQRFETVQKALDLVKKNIDFVAVHDAVRCCITENWINDCFKKAKETKAAILACRVTDTLKKVPEKTIAETIDRSQLYQAQTPQVFAVELLKKAYANLTNLDITKISDDAQLVEALGEEISIIETDSSNIKITHKSDIAIAEAILKARAKAATPKGPLGPYSEAQW